MVSATLQCFGGKIMCLVPTTLPAAYLPILIESDEGQIEKALNTRMFRSYLYSRATNVTLSQCPFP